MRRAFVVLAVAALAGGGWILARDRTGSDSGKSHGARVESYTLHSALVRRDLHQIVVTPRGGGQGRPLLVFLHGRSADADYSLNAAFFDALRRLGPRAPVVLFPDGGDDSYWHDRRGARWGSSVLRESIPAALARTRTNPKRVAIGGISMGGFGALDLARLAPLRFCAVGAHSPALWTSGGESAAGAFDDAADFERHDLIRFAREHTLLGIPTWIDVGRDDPFARADQTLAQELRAHGVHVAFHLHAGDHGGWSHRMPQYLRWYAARLAAC